MEQMHSLESSLPPEQPPTKQAIESLNLELSQEFKLAANAVTRLYRVANEKNSLTKHQGYLTCLDDILCALDSNVTADELRAWCYKRRNDILSNSQDKSLKSGERKGKKA
ncbi:YJR056C-like protein [Saccharomyces cerevisiae FostersB]|nr:YJR056C-like protein [Saccharomyces cerevisiae FostersB]